MCSTSVFARVIAMVFNFAIIFIRSVFTFKIFLRKYNRFLPFHAIPSVRLLMVLFFSFQS